MKSLKNILLLHLFTVLTVSFFSAFFHTLGDNICNALENLPQAFPMNFVQRFIYYYIFFFAVFYFAFCFVPVLVMDIIYSYFRCSFIIYFVLIVSWFVFISFYTQNEAVTYCVARYNREKFTIAIILTGIVYPFVAKKMYKKIYGKVVNGNKVSE